MRLISLHTDAVRALERLRVPFDDLTPEGLWGSSYHLIGVTAEQLAVLDSWHIGVNDVTPRALASFVEAAPQLKEMWPTPAPLRVRAVSESRTELPRPDLARLEAPREKPRTEAFRVEHPRPELMKSQPQETRRDVADTPVPMHDEPKKHGDVLEREIVGRAAAAAEAKGDTGVATDGKATNGNGGATAAFAAPAAPAGAGTAAGKLDPTRLRVSVGGKYREASVESGKILLDGKSFDSPAQATKSVAPAKGDWVFWEYFDNDAGKWRMLDRDWQPGTSN